MLSVAEAALEAWSALQPAGYAVPRPIVTSRLDEVVRYLPGRPGGGHAPLQSRRLGDLLGAHEVGAIPNLPEEARGEVQFLEFWSAFSQVSREAAAASTVLLVPPPSPQRGSTGPAAGSPDADVDGLAAELDLLRDFALQELERAPGEGEVRVAVPVLRGLALGTMAASVAPAFWRAAVQSLGQQDDEHLNLEDLTIVLLSWLHDLIAWESDPRTTLRGGAVAALLSREYGEDAVDSFDPQSSTGSGTASDPDVADLVGTLILPFPQTLRDAGAGDALAREQLGGLETLSPSDSRCLRTFRVLQAAVVPVEELDDSWRSPPSMPEISSLRPNFGGDTIGGQYDALEGWRCPSPPPSSGHISTFAFGPGAAIWASEAAADDGDGEADEEEPTAGRPARGLRTAMLSMRPEDAQGGSRVLVWRMRSVAPPFLRTALAPCPALLHEASYPSAEVHPRCEGFPVYLHIYDVSQGESIRRLNAVLAHKLSPLKFGGVFHAGVEVNGREWSFGCSDDPRVPGVTCSAMPGDHPDHHWRQMVCLPNTILTAHGVEAVVSQLALEYPGTSYDVLHRNCCHFADDFCQRLGVGRIPRWVYRLARIGAHIDGVLQAAARCNASCRPSSASSRCGASGATPLLGERARTAVAL